jgi:hypothetical protein
VRVDPIAQPSLAINTITLGTDIRLFVIGPNKIGPNLGLGPLRSRPWIPNRESKYKRPTAWSDLGPDKSVFGLKRGPINTAPRPVERGFTT